jgi:ATP-dependent DNA helicase RecG
LIIPTEKISERLELFVQSNNGFELAEYDLKLRGPGDVFGTAQSGLLSLKIAKLTDTAIIKVAREAAEDTINSDPNLILYPRLLEKLNKFLDLDALQ